MIKKKAKRKTAAKKMGKKRSTAKKGKELNPAEVRKDIAHMVKSSATGMAEAVIGEGMKGQLATVKYLFEVASIYPPSTDGMFGTAEEDSLAKTLLQRMNVPDEPVVRNEEDAPQKPAVLVTPPAAEVAEESEGTEPDTKAQLENEEPVLV
jgi:hypothetical protein